MQFAVIFVSKCRHEGTKEIDGGTILALLAAKFYKKAEAVFRQCRAESETLIGQYFTNR